MPDRRSHLVSAMPKLSISSMMPNERPLRSAPAPIEPPRLLWASIKYTNAGVASSDATRFPTIDDVNARHGECSRVRGRLESGERFPDNPMTLVAFEEAVMEAQSRLLVLDPHFDAVGVHALRDALDYNSAAKEIRLLTGQSEDDTAPWRQDLEQRINMDRTDRRDVDVEWRKLRRRSFPFLHDRFAIVDDALWHFGATVGGGHEGVNAASGPWSAVDARAVEFFDECWKVSYDE